MSADWGAADQSLYGQLLSHNQIIRVELCTVARIGVAFRQAAPERARQWANRLAAHPIYKAGQFLFDLTEWEDFMLDGPPPAADPNAAASLFMRVARNLGFTVADPVMGLGLDTASLPELEPGFYLYRDVVLGLIYIALTAAG